MVRDISRCLGIEEALQKIPQSEGWLRHCRKFPVPQDAGMTPCIRRAMPVSQGMQPLSSTLCGLPTEDRGPLYFQPRIVRYYKTPRSMKQA